MSTKNKEKGFFKLMKTLDYFAVTFQFRINNYKKYGSATGGIIFCIYLIISISYFFVRFKDYVSWEDRRLLFIDKSPEKSPVLNLKNLSVEYAISINFDNDTSLFETRYKDLFDIEHRYILVNNTLNNSIITRTLAKTRNCRKDDFIDKIDESSSIHKNKLLYKCFDLEPGFNLEGIYTDNIFSYVEIFLKINKRYFNNYTHLEQIFKENQIKYTIYYTDNFVDVSQLNHTTTTHIEAIYTYINLEYYERMNIFLQQVEFCTDTNLFYKEFICKKFQKFFKFENKLGPLPYRMALPEESRYPISKFILRAESTTKQIIVSYIKISEFLSNVLALLVNGLVILNMIIIPMNESKARQTINEKVMKVKDIIKIEDRHFLDYFSENFNKNKNYNINSNILNSQSNEKAFANDQSILNNKIPKYPNKRNYLDKTSSNSKMKNPKQIEMLNLNEISAISSNSPKLDINKNNPVLSEMSKNDLTNSDRIKINFDNNLIDINAKELSLMNINNTSILNNYNKNITKENIYKNKIDTTYFGAVNENQEIKHMHNRSIEKEIEWIRDLEKNTILKRKNPFKIRLRDVIRNAFRCKRLNTKIEINNIADTKINNTIDIINYITKMQEIEILKYLILDEDMIEIMDFLSKPHISSNEMNRKSQSFEKFFNNKVDKSSATNNMASIKKLFDKIMKKAKPNLFELKLMKLFDHEIKNLKN